MFSEEDDPCACGWLDRQSCVWPIAYSSALRVDGADPQRSKWRYVGPGRWRAGCCGLPAVTSPCEWPTEPAGRYAGCSRPLPAGRLRRLTSPLLWQVRQGGLSVKPELLGLAMVTSRTGSGSERLPRLLKVDHGLAALLVTVTLAGDDLSGRSSYTSEANTSHLMHFCMVATHAHRAGNTPRMDIRSCGAGCGAG